MSRKFCLLVFGIAVLSCTTNAQKKSRTVNVHYFYNSGWLVETEKHFLIFDFIPYQNGGIYLNTLSQSLAGNPLRKKLIVFISHDHEDHYNDSIYGLKKQDSSTRFILGWKPKLLPAIGGITALQPGDSLVQNDLVVHTHAATDDGSAFLVRVDGLNIYHAGDHAMWVNELENDYKKELLLIKNQRKIDLAFLPVARGMFSKCAVDSVMEKSVKLAMEILKPQVVGLQHIGCEDKLYQYAEVRQKLTQLKTKWLVPGTYNAKFSAIIND